MEFPNLFKSIKINGMELKNRIVMPAVHLGYTPEGEVTDRLIDFYSTRARGGVGFIIVGGCPIDEYSGMASMLSINDDRYIPGLERLTRAVKSENARIAAQLYQGGRYTYVFKAGKTPRAFRIEATGYVPAISRSFEPDEGTQVLDLDLKRGTGPTVQHQDLDA